jgi:hypothetical protein
MLGKFAAYFVIIDLVIEIITALELLGVWTLSIVWFSK